MSQSDYSYLNIILNGNCYPQEIFLEQNLIEKFICPIDFGICRNPIIDNCGHTYGKKCLMNCLKLSNKCPLTNNKYPSFQKFPINYGIKNFLFDLKIKCINYNKTCSWTGKLEELEKHLENDCNDIKEECPIEGCHEKFSRGKLIEHIEKNCNFVKISCLFEKNGCKKKINNKLLLEHLIKDHYDEIFESVKRFEEIHKEKEIYEKKYNDLLMVFALMNSENKKIFSELKKENSILKNKLNVIKNEKNNKKRKAEFIDEIKINKKQKII